MSVIRLPPQPRRALFHQDSQRGNKHTLWTQDFSKTRGWSTPEERDISTAISAATLRHGTPSAAITRWAFSHPNCNHFMFVAQLTLSNYDHFDMRDVLTVLDSVPRLEELQLCRVNIIDNTRTGAFVRPTDMVRSLKRLAIEACNITEGLADAYYDLLFRFISLFERIERLRLVATVYRNEGLFYSPNFYGLRLPTILHLEAEGFFAFVLVEFFRERYPVQELVSLHLSRCLASWSRIYWIEALVRMAGPTLKHFAWRPNLKASWNGCSYDDRQSRYQNDLVDAFRQCTALRELELGLHAHHPGYGFSQAASLFRRILEVLPESRLDRLAFVLDIGDFSADVVPWAALDPQLSRVCSVVVGRGGQPTLHVRIDRYESKHPKRPWERTDYLADREFWAARLPIMHRKMLVQDRVRTERLSVERYNAPMSIDLQREARLAAPGLRSLFDL